MMGTIFLTPSSRDSTTCTRAMLCYVRPGHLEALLVELPAPHAKVVRQFKGEDTLRNDAHTPLVRVGVWVVVVEWGETGGGGG